MFSIRRFVRALKAMGEENILPMDVRRLDLQAGDTAVIRCTTDITTDRMRNIIDAWNTQFPGVKAVVVDQYLDISIVSKLPAAQRPEARQ